MKVIIAGGRDHALTASEITELNMLKNTIPITEVVSGRARGVDRGGEKWAIAAGIPVKKFPAQWDHFGRDAGFLRNLQMAEYADALIAIRGGVGTADMVEQAIRLGLRPIIEINR